MMTTMIYIKMPYYLAIKRVSKNMSMCVYSLHVELTFIMKLSCYNETTKYE